MATTPSITRGSGTRRRGLAATAIVAAMMVLGATAAITARMGPSSATGAMSWVDRQRPAGPVLTVSGWITPLTDGSRLRVVTTSETELVGVAADMDPGSIVVPSDSPTVIELRTSGGWSVGYKDDAATVLVHEGALPVPGAT